MNRLLDILIPRRITEEVALREEGDHLVIACSMADVKPGERFDAVATMRVFNLFGFALFPTMIGEPRPWLDIYDVQPTQPTFFWRTTNAEQDVLAERQRQIGKGWTPEHDDEHDPAELARAAAAYLLSAYPRGTLDMGFTARLWPWDSGLNPKSKREDLVRAAALAIAAIERLDREQAEVQA